MAKLSNLIKWLDQNILRVLLVIYIFLIPLYPKLPFKVVNYTYVAIRLEDFYVAFVVLIFLIQLFRKKVSFPKKFTKPIILFWISAFAAALSGIFITNTIDYPQLGFLHAARRVEYMIMFFIAYASIKSKRDFKILFGSLIISLVLVNLYGLGQRFAGFPAVSTMNPEFAKGRILFLTPEARLSSTFAGHYDLAAYLVFLMPISLFYYLSLEKTKRFYQTKRILFFTIFLLALSVQIMTASRTSFIAYILSTPLFLLWIKKYRLAAFIIILSLLMTFFSRDLGKRFAQTFQIRQLLINEQTGEAYVAQDITADNLPAGTAYVKVKKRKMDEKELLKLRAQLAREATMSGKTKKATDSGYIEITGMTADISFATRLQVEWPRAINSLISNPILGTGPSSITESTDNNYLRLLGEFGLVGASLFMYVLYLLAMTLFKASRKYSGQLKILLLGILFGFFGLGINASYIDVFEASKVAYVFWFVMGITIGYLNLKKPQLDKLI